MTNCSKYRSYVLSEGYRIARDVPFFKDDPTVYNYPASYTGGDSLRMDIVYPANASVKVPVVISFSYSNSYFGNANQNQRLNLAYTLAGFNDSFLEGAPAHGIAWAIADHPKYCPWGNGKPVGGANDTYKSYETNPDAAQKVKSAIRTLRKKGEELGLSGKIGVYGFSRGSDAGSMAVGDRVVPEFENAGINLGVSDDVQAALLGSGVFDFTYIYHSKDDGDSNLESRCPWAWGELAKNYDKWQKMGSYYLTETKASAPTLFFYNTSDANYYQEQITRFKAKLDSLGVPTSIVKDYGNGHAVPQTSSALSLLYDFLKSYLTPPSLTSKNEMGQNPEKISLTVTPNPANELACISFYLYNAGKVQITLLNQTGAVLHKTEKYFSRSGIHTDTLPLSEFNLREGIYFVKIQAGGNQEMKKLILE